MLNRLLLPMALVSLTGCNLIMKGSCDSLQKQICEECDISDYEEDVICACLNEGEIDNADDYYDDEDEAELACNWLQQQFRSTYLTNEDIAECRRQLDFLRKYEKDACELFGYSDGGGGGSDGSDGSYYYYTDGSDGSDGSYYYDY